MLSPALALVESDRIKRELSAAIVKHERLLRELQVRVERLREVCPHLPEVVRGKKNEPSQYPWACSVCGWCA